MDPVIGNAVASVHNRIVRENKHFRAENERLERDNKRLRAALREVRDRVNGDDTGMLFDLRAIVDPLIT